MPKLFRTLFLTIAVAAPMPALAAPVQVSAAQLEQAHQAACDDMARVLLSDEGLIERTEQMLDGMVAGMFRNDENLQSLEARFPGMRTAVTIGLRPKLIELNSEILPAYRADLASLYCANLTTSEANRSAAFFRTSLMRKFITQTQAGLKYDGMAKEIAADKDISTASIRSSAQTAGIQAVQTLTPAERTQFVAFFGSPLGAKFRSLNPQKLQIDAKWSNYATPADEQEIEALTIQTMIDHIRKSDPNLADTIQEELASETKSN